MPLTKPKCLDCDYSLNGIKHSKMCPECGCVERKLLFDGSSKTLSVCIVVLVSIIFVSCGVILASLVHKTFTPQYHPAWVLETSKNLRKVMVPTLFAISSLAITLSYVILTLAHINHNMNRVRSVQLSCCIGLCVIAIFIAVLWAI